MLPPRTDRAVELMMRFAERTGLTSARPPRRYLWTDAFAVCNFVALSRVTGEGKYTELALRLVEQVHSPSGAIAPTMLAPAGSAGSARRRARPTRRAAGSGSGSRSLNGSPRSRWTSDSSGSATASTSTT